MKNLLLSSLLLGILLACAPKIHSGYKRSEDNAQLRAIFNKDASYLYKAKIDILKYYLSGLLFIKPISEDTFRLVFTNEIGIKFFDMEFFPNGKKVHYVIEKMNKKVVINTLEKDIKLLLMNNYEIKKGEKLKSPTGQNVFKFTDKKEGYFYFLNSSEEIERVELTSKKKVKVEVELKDYHEKVPHLINIKHLNFKFNIELNYLQR